MLGHEDELGSRRLSLELAAGVESVQLGHSNVQHNEIGIHFGCSFQKCPSIAYRAHNFAMWLQNVLKRIRQHPMVIRNQYPWATHDSTLPFGAQPFVIRVTVVDILWGEQATGR